jgi:hypothetical protein
MGILVVTALSAESPAISSLADSHPAPRTPRFVNAAKRKPFLEFVLRAYWPLVIEAAGTAPLNPRL